uniref:Angiotensin-converting enzyme n=1 Tax=Macrostomum lignano TaxID=282301 RepID=A0A1I8FK01_9PLAT
MASPDVSEVVKKALWSRWRDRQRQAELVRAQGGPGFLSRLWSSFSQRPAAGLYKELHGYVRHALMQKYPASIFPPTGHIPGHILGHMWGGRWDDLEPFTKPQMFEASQDFFASLGFGNMTDTFWAKSVLEKLPGVDMVCHASAWDFYTDKGDFRIKQCTEITGHYLAVTHHEMGHIQYYQQYEKQPVVFARRRQSRFSRGHRGDTIELSVMTPGHLRKLGLLESDSESDEFYLNSLFLMALKKGRLPAFWYKLFKGVVPKNLVEQRMVNQRCQTDGGFQSAVLRSEEDFDAGAIYHVVANVEYMRRVQFQFHQSLCQAAGVTEKFSQMQYLRQLCRRRKAQSPAGERHLAALGGGPVQDQRHTADQRQTHCLTTSHRSRPTLLQEQGERSLGPAAAAAADAQQLDAKRCRRHSHGMCNEDASSVREMANHSKQLVKDDRAEI